MTQNEIIQMAIQAELNLYVHDLTEKQYIQVIETFAKLVRNDYSNKHAQLWLKRIDEAVKEEREACAKIVEESSLPDAYSEPCLLVIAEEIRARGRA
jgi:hypothetical protein